MRTVARVAGIVIASVVFLVAVTMLVGLDDHPGPRPVPWTDARLAAALTAQAAGLGANVAPGQVRQLLARFCPYIANPIGLVQHRPAYVGTEAEADAVMSVLAQSGRCMIVMVTP